MADNRLTSEEFSGQVTSPGGFVFGVQGWNWGAPRPTSVTFFLDGTAFVGDQHGRPIRGTVVDGKEVRFAVTPPVVDDSDLAMYESLVTERAKLATHAQVVAALAAEGVSWTKLSCAGWPQLPYDDLKKLPRLPPTPKEELAKIRDGGLRRDALRARREVDEARERELSASRGEE